MDGLVWSDDVVDDARRLRAEVAAALADLGVPGELVLTGGSSVVGLLTRGDVDLHLRVPPHRFSDAVARLGEVYPPTSEAAWAGTLVVFEVPADRPAGLAVTPTGSEHDRRFVRSWDVLRRDAALRAEYNALKVDADTAEEYERRKSALFSRLGGEEMSGRCASEAIPRAEEPSMGDPHPPREGNVR